MSALVLFQLVPSTSLRCPSTSTSASLSGRSRNCTSLIQLSRIDIIDDLFSSSEPVDKTAVTSREFVEILARAASDDDESGAVSIGTIASVGASLLPTVISGIAHLFGNQ